MELYFQDCDREIFWCDVETERGPFGGWLQKVSVSKMRSMDPCSLLLPKRRKPAA